MNKNVQKDSVQLVNVRISENASFREQMYVEIYKTYVSTAEAISIRRQNANSFFLTINVVLFGAGSYVKDISFVSKTMLALSGITICYTWYRMIRSYKGINSGKFKVIHKIEEHLPFSPFTEEWQVLGRGKDKKKYLPFTNIEIIIPIVFLLLHVISFAADHQSFVSFDLFSIFRDILSGRSPI